MRAERSGLSQTYKVIGPYVRIETARRIPTPVLEEVYTEQERKAQLPETFWSQREDPIGYPVNLEPEPIKKQPELLLQQPYQPTDLPDQSEPIPEPLIAEPPRQYPEQQMIQVPVNEGEVMVDLTINHRYDIVYKAARDTIMRIHDDNDPAQLFTDLHDEHYADQIDYALRNLHIINKIQN